jgi:hypothetical protein
MSKSATLTGVPLRQRQNCPQTPHKLPLPLCCQIQISIIPLVSPAPYLLWLVQMKSITSESGGTYAVNFNAQYNIDPTDRTGLR